MTKLVCEICGSRLVKNAAGIIECSGCGMQYEDAQIREQFAKQTAEEKLLSDNRRKKTGKLLKIAVFLLCVGIAVVMLSLHVLIPARKYNQALELMDSENYEEAIPLLESLEGYKDSVQRIEDCRTGIPERDYAQGLALIEAGEYKQAIPIFQSLGNYEKSMQLRVLAEKEAQYADTVALMDAGNVVEAYEAFQQMNGFKDSAEKVSALYEQYKTEKLKVAAVGEYVFFGAYEQDNNTSNGKEDIEWLVLQRDDQHNRILVLSRYGLNCYRYVKLTQDRGTWEKHPYRKWLNDTFLNAAFSEEQKESIHATTVKTEAYVGGELFTKCTADISTQDKLFLLSSNELAKYIPAESDRLCTPTNFAIANGVMALRENTTWWGLRDVNANLDGFSFVWDNGIINNAVCNCPFYFENTTIKNFNKSIVNGAIRPAMWIDLED